MSDDEREHSEEEGGRGMPPPESGPSEAELAMQKRREAGQGPSSDDIDEEGREMLELNKKEREVMEQEIEELRQRSEQRKIERKEEEKLLLEKRQAEDAERKAMEEERKSKKDAEENARKAARAEKMAEFKKFENASRPNFVITKREDGTLETESTEEGGGERKSREQLEQEKRAILKQRVAKLDTSGYDQGKFTEKAKELHKEIYRLESEKYDLEKRFKQQQYDMMELAERARQMNKVGRGASGLKRVQLQEDESDKFQELFAGAPAKIEMYSIYERQKDKRSYDDRHTIFRGPRFGFAAERIAPARKLIWSEAGLPEYIDIEGGEAPPAEEAAAEEE